MTKFVIIGAGIGGLTTAAVLAKAGLDVTVLEAHIYPGGCAGTFFHQGFRFDAGATLAGGFYPGGPMDRVARAAGIDAWPAQHSEPAMQVHLPDGAPITRWGDERRWEERLRQFGPASATFWRWQEPTADALWDLALRTPAWPPQSLAETGDLTATGLGWLSALLAGGGLKHLPGLAADAVRPVAARLGGQSDRLRLFIDGQLLIAAQATSRRANALYGASALDLPRRGIVHLQGGIGGIAETLVAAIRSHGGAVHYRQEAVSISQTAAGQRLIRTKRGDEFLADRLIANLPPWNIRDLMADEAPASLRRLPPKPQDGWGAFMLYVGADGASLPEELPLHHQVIRGEPLGEGNSVFVSISPGWDEGRGPSGSRAVTISTHTHLDEWWRLFQADRPRYEDRKQAYAQKLMQAAEQAVPGLRGAARLVKPGTPVTFQRFTRRRWGWVGGFPQTNLLRGMPPRLAQNLWMVGDSIFPGQSTAAVALGGLRVAAAALRGLGTATNPLGSPPEERSLAQPG